MKIKLALLIIVSILLTHWPLAILAEELRSKEEMLFEEIPMVVTSSRRLEAIRESPVAIELISEEEIRRSKVNNLWDILRFRAGVDVLDSRTILNNRAIVAVRGFPEEFVNSMQVLIDGRSVYVAESGGIFWQSLPLQVQDIEKIEIVRGPNSALFGSNSGQGVINIITRKPQTKAKIEMDERLGNLNLFQSAAAIENVFNRFSYRLSHTYLTDSGFPSTQGDKANDHRILNKANFRGDLQITDHAELEFLGGVTKDDLRIPPGETLDRYRTHFEMLKFSMDWTDSSSMEVMVSRNDIENDVPNQIRHQQYDAEFLHRFQWLDKRLYTTWGGNYRDSIVDSAFVYSAATPRHTNPIWRGFVHQTVRMMDPLMLVGAVSLEDSKTGGTQQTDYQTAVVSPFNPHHTLRASYSLSHTIPPIFLKKVNTNFDNPTLLFQGNPDIRPAKLQSYEIGYVGNFLKNRFNAGAQFYYMLRQDIEIKETVITKFVPLRTRSIFRNGEDAIARGVETQVRYRLGEQHFYVNYTYEVITDLFGDSTALETNPSSTPRHKFNFGGTLQLPYHFSAGVDAGYKDKYKIFSIQTVLDAPAYWRLDARISYQPLKSVELFIAGQNLAMEQHQEFPGAVEVPRTYYGGVQINFKK